MQTTDKVNILLVDDRPENLVALESVLSDLGQNLVTATSGREALKCLLDGFGLPVNYARLREACQTDVDGTSIDTLEQIARQFGLDAEQVMLPPEDLLLAEARALPALVVTTLPGGATHFVVAWRAHASLCINLCVSAQTPAGAGHPASF